jgi:hypothetical protein
VIENKVLRKIFGQKKDVAKPERKRSLGRPRCGWVYNIEMNLRRVERGGMYWIDLTQDRDQWRAVVNTVLHLQVLRNVGKFLSSCATGNCSRRELEERAY